MLLTPRKVSLPAPGFPFRLFVRRVVKLAFVKKNHTCNPDLFGQGTIIHVAHMLTNTLLVLLGQWRWSSEHIPVKHPPRATGMKGSRTRWFHSFPAVGHCSAQDRLVAVFQLTSCLRRLVGYFSSIAFFLETYQRPFSSSK